MVKVIFDVKYFTVIFHSEIFNIKIDKKGHIFEYPFPITEIYPEIVTETHIFVAVDFTQKQYKMIE